MNKVFSLVTLAALTASSNATAEGNWYVGFDIHSSTVDLNSDTSAVPTISSGVKSIDDNGGGLSILLGHNLTPWFALELSASSDYIDLLDYENYYYPEPNIRAYEYALYRAKIYSFALSSKFSYRTPLNLSLYAKPGIGYTITDMELDGGASYPDVNIDVDEKNKNVHLNFEVGAEYFLTDSLSANIAYERKFDAIDFSASDTNVDEFSQDLIKGGIRYYF